MNSNNPYIVAVHNFLTDNADGYDKEYMDVEWMYKMIRSIEETLLNLRWMNNYMEKGVEHPPIHKFWYAFIKVNGALLRGDYFPKKIFPTNVKSEDERVLLAKKFLLVLADFCLNDKQLFAIENRMVDDSFSIYCDERPPSYYKDLLKFNLTRSG